jgi:chemotaxis protein MotB
MYSMSVVNLSKFQQFAISIRSGFSDWGGNSTGRHAILKGETIMGPVSSELPSLFRSPATKGRQTVEPPAGYSTSFEDDNRAAQTDSPAQWVVLRDDLFFARSSTDLSEDSQAKLRAVRGKLSSSFSMIAVEGYTSDRAASGSSAPDAWRLAAERAISVIRFLVSECQIDPSRFHLRAYGDWTYLPDSPIQKIPKSRPAVVETPGGHPSPAPRPDRGSNDRAVVLLQVQNARFTP